MCSARNPHYFSLQTKMAFPEILLKLDRMLSAAWFDLTRCYTTHQVSLVLFLSSDGSRGDKVTWITNVPSSSLCPSIWAIYSDDRDAA